MGTDSSQIKEQHVGVSPLSEIYTNMLHVKKLCENEFIDGNKCIFFYVLTAFFKHFFSISFVC